jgi:hypothetical protein
MRAVLELVRDLKILSITASVPAIVPAAESDSVHRPANWTNSDRRGRWMFKARGNLPTSNRTATKSRTADSRTTGSPTRSKLATIPFPTVFEPIRPRTLGVARLIPVSFDGRHVGLFFSLA